MASISHTTIRRHPAERSMARIAFGSYMPDFFTIRLARDFDLDFPLYVAKRLPGSRKLKRRKRIYAQPTKLLPTAKRFVQKLGRKARVRMLQAAKN